MFIRVPAQLAQRTTGMQYGIRCLAHTAYSLKYIAFNLNFTLCVFSKFCISFSVFRLHWCKLYGKSKINGVKNMLCSSFSMFGVKFSIRRPKKEKPQTLNLKH